MEILVTGCNGYIGAHLVKQLAKRGHQPYGLDFQKRNNISSYVKKVWDSDITLLSTWEQDLVDKKWDVVCHLAALISVGESVEKPTDYFETNWRGTVNLLKNLNYKHFVFASTAAATSPNSPYGISKLAAEHSVCELSKNYTNLRFYNVIGEAGFPVTNQDGIFVKLKKAQETGIFTIFGKDYNTKDGTCVRDYIHVMDIANAICNCVEAPAKNNPFECLGYGKSTTVQEIVEAYREVNNIDFEIQIGERRKGDAEKSEVPFVSSFMEKKYSNIQDLVKI